MDVILLIIKQIEFNQISIILNNYLKISRFKFIMMHKKVDCNTDLFLKKSKVRT